MSSTYTTTYSYTVTDVRKVLDQVRADFHMAAQSTRLWTDSFVDAIVDDLKRYAEYGYLNLVAIYLRDEAGNAIRAATYTVSENASGWVASKPGNMLWPRDAGTSLRATIDLNSKWYALTPEKQAEFERGMRLDWSAASSQDLNFPTLSASADRSYASNGFGVKKSVFK